MEQRQVHLELPLRWQGGNGQLPKGDVPRSGCQIVVSTGGYLHGELANVASLLISQGEPDFPVASLDIPSHPPSVLSFPSPKFHVHVANTQPPPQQPDGTFKLSFPSVTPSKPIPYVHPPHDTGHFVRALVLSAPAGTTLLGVSDPMTASDWAQLWGRVNGVQCVFEPAPLKAVEDALPPGLGREIGESCLYASEFGYDGGDPSVVYPKDVGVEVGELMTCKRYIEETDWSSVLGREGAVL